MPNISGVILTHNPGSLPIAVVVVVVVVVVDGVVVADAAFGVGSHLALGSGFSKGIQRILFYE